MEEIKGEKEVGMRREKKKEESNSVGGFGELVRRAVEAPIAVFHCAQRTLCGAMELFQLFDPSPPFLTAYAGLRKKKKRVREIQYTLTMTTSSNRDHFFQTS